MSIQPKVKELLSAVNNQTVKFTDVLEFIAEHYAFNATAFKNGDLHNTADENQGSCKIFSFAQLQDLSQEQTLALFVEHYQNVLENPDDTAHQNIRQFMKNGWEGISFSGQVLQEK